MLAKMAAMRAAKERKRLEGTPPERGPGRVPAGILLGVLQWQAACGEVKRIVVRQGARANQIRIPGCRRDHGFDWLFRQLRGKLSTLAVSMVLTPEFPPSPPADSTAAETGS